MTIEDYFDAKGIKADFTAKDKIAVVYAEGTIQDGDEETPGSIYDGRYVKILRKIRLDESIKAVVLRINSPGGSVMASENIFREVDLLRKSGRPVVVSMGGRGRFRRILHRLSGRQHICRTQHHHRIYRRVRHDPDAG